MSYAIQVKDLSKEYVIGGRHHTNEQDGHLPPGYQSLRDLVTTGVASTWRRIASRSRDGSTVAPKADQKIWALYNVSFDIQQGEVVGVIGRNGAGKSTLLKILSRITEPTHGEAAIHGRIGSLLEVGTGFHPELTGHENIYLNGAILGMKRQEITRKFDEIVAFAELEKFMDTPVKHYSSGMYMRLAFSVAAHLEPDILLVDEVLAVGDATFQKKCLGKMDDVAKGGRTVLLVSHNMAAISSLCQRVIYLKDGQLQTAGSSAESIARYVTDEEISVDKPLAERTDREGSGEILATQIRWLDAKTLEPLVVVLAGQEVYLEVSYEVADDYTQPVNSIVVNIGIRTQLDRFVTVLNSRMTDSAFEQKLPAKGKLYCHIERFPVMPGRYFGHCHLLLNGTQSDRILNAFAMDVEDGDFYGTGMTLHWNQQSVYVPHRWFSEGEIQKAQQEFRG